MNAATASHAQYRVALLINAARAARAAQRREALERVLAS